MISEFKATLLGYTESSRSAWATLCSYLGDPVPDKKNAEKKPI
jgi:hypothetical protein